MKSIIPISKFKSGETIQGFYLCVEKYLRHTRSGELYLDLLLKDQTGQINAKVWDNVKEYEKKFKSGDPVALKGQVDLFLDKLQLNIKRINKATIQNYARYGFDPSLIVPTAKEDPKKMWKEVIKVVRSFKDPFLKKLCYNIYKNNKDKLLIYPATLSMNHNYRSGLLEHILSMSRSALTLARLYKLDRDLILTGILVHDIGKLREINYDYESTLTKDGNLIGHLVISRDIVLEEANKIKKFPKGLLIKIEHIILSHQAKYNWNNSIKPAFKEALLVQSIKLMDGQLNVMDITFNEDRESGEFTNHFNYFKTHLYKGSDGTK
ncbi:MAG: HD domain-containing protein [Candidatus Marinimicrobia bacterium]|jgi:3'-5' exoribonuclease|nr:HD domain-containing protein [Candidatus Neomarinimicrobiota bacterium]MBT7524894.1 HD domain-containing protein [Candidatus Neomarinimicrobiota bacterium]|tara:strand:+ start:3099 stop:4064 length:966 start_codon:yes stop_codon:yes gene_type:complete